MIRVILAEDHHLVRQGIRALIGQADDIEVLAEATDGAEAVALIAQLRPDVAVLDLAMPRLNGVSATEQIRALGLPTEVIILSMHSDETLVRQALRYGARGYLLKRAVSEELLLAIRAASRGETYLSPGIADIVLADFLAGQEQAALSPLDRLSPREREVLQLVAEGHTSAEIARRLLVSVKTVEKHRASLMARLEVRDVAALVRLAIKHGLIFLDE